MPQLAVVAALLLILAACSTTRPPAPPPPVQEAKVPSTSRYAEEKDFAPPRPIKAEHVYDAVPRPDPLLSVGNKSPYTIDGVDYTVLDDHRNYKEQGIASWYGAKFTGYETSNGEVYDLYMPTAAHKSLPIPCYARVTNLDNGNSIVVRVNDRGPFHSDRLIDLSYAAAVKLDYMETGTARVEVEVIDVVGVEDRRDMVLGDYRYLQIGAFGKESTAQSLRVRLEALLSAPVFITEFDSGSNTLYRVRVGPVNEGSQLLLVQQTLQDNGFGAGQLLP